MSKDRRNKTETAETSPIMKKLKEAEALNRDVRSWRSWLNGKILEDQRAGRRHNYFDNIRESIQEPQTLEEVVGELRKWMRIKLPNQYGAIGAAIVKGLKMRYIEMSGDAELDPELSGEALYQYFDSKYGWTAEEEQKKSEKRRRFQDLQTGFRIRMILGPLTQGMPPAGYKEELRKLGWYKTYREELRFHGWSEEQIDEFIRDLGGMH